LTVDYSAFKDAPGFLHKPETRTRANGRKKRTEAAIKRDIRAQVFERDQCCRFEGMGPGPCRGPWQWAHLAPRRRSQTVGMDPEYRHTTTYTAMGCQIHHEMYDAHVFDIHYIDPERGADGPIEVVRR
jgi:hypothetical protein